MFWLCLVSYFFSLQGRSWSQVTPRCSPHEIRVQETNGFAWHAIEYKWEKLSGPPLSISVLHYMQYTPNQTPICTSCKYAEQNGVMVALQPEYYQSFMGINDCKGGPVDKSLLDNVMYQRQEGHICPDQLMDYVLTRASKICNDMRETYRRANVLQVTKTAGNNETDYSNLEDDL